MIYFSRVTYLAKLEMFKSFNGSVASSELTRTTSTLDFFFLGPPHTDPVTPSGTVGMAVSEAFLTKNLDKIAWSFFGDSGAILSGRRIDINRECAYRARLSANDLLKILEILKSIPRQRLSLILKGSSDLEFLDSVSHLLDFELFESTRRSSRALDWRIEVAVRSDYRISEADVLALALPNTYRTVPLILDSTRDISSGKVIYYNPKSNSAHKCLANFL